MIDMFLKDGVLSNASLADFLAWLLEPLTFYAYAVGALGFLLVLASINLVLMWAKRRVLNRDLRAGISALEALTTREQLSEHYESVREVLENQQSLKHDWHEFEETLILPESVDQPILNTKRPRHFFDSERLSASIQPLVRGETLIGLGLLFTFAGLIAALVKAQDVFTAGADTNDIKQGLAVLISTAGAKFIASLGGVLSSIVTNAVQSYYLRKSDDQVRAFTDKLETLVRFVSAEQLAIEQRNELQRQTTAVEGLGNQIAVAVGDRIDNAMSGIPPMIQAAMNPTTEAIERALETMSAQGNEGIAQMAKDFQESLTGASEESMRTVVAQLTSLSETLESTTRGFAETQEDLKTALSGMKDQVREQAEFAANELHEQIRKAIEDGAKRTSEEVQKAVDNIRGNLEAPAEQMRDGIDRWNAKAELVADSLKRVNEQLVIHRSTIEGVNTSMTASSRSMVEASESVKATADPIREIAEILDKSVGEIRDLHEASLSNANETGANAQVALETTRRLFDELKAAWSNQSELLHGADAELEGAFMRINQQLKESLDVLKQFVTDTDSQLAKSVESLSLLGDELRDTAEQLSERKAS